MEITTSYKLADHGNRVVAFLIDSAVLAAIGGIFGANDAWLLGGIIGFLVSFGYQWVFLVRNNGQTPGKMVTGLRVIKSDGTPITDIDVVMRALGYLINSTLLGLPWLWAFIDPMHQGWHDKLARTYVVMADREKVKTTPKAKNEELQ